MEESDMANIIPEAFITREQILQNFSRYTYSHAEYEQLKSMLISMKDNTEKCFGGVNIYRIDSLRYYCYRH